MAEKVISEIGKDHQLKHTETVDKSAPVIDSKLLCCSFYFSSIPPLHFPAPLCTKGLLPEALLGFITCKLLEIFFANLFIFFFLLLLLGTVHVKKIDREGFLTEVEKGAELKHADTIDKSAPAIDRKFFLFILLAFLIAFLSSFFPWKQPLPPLNRALLSDVELFLYIFTHKQLFCLVRSKSL